MVDRAVVPRGRREVVKLEELGLELPPGADKLRDQLTVLLVILHSLTANTFNGDVLALALYGAEDVCKTLGIDDDTTRQVIRAFQAYSRALRRLNPLSKMYPE